jgi:hypothetical protein
MPRIVVRYLTGSRANQADALSAETGEDLIAGRDPLASIHFDPEQDDLVSRQHLKITHDPNVPGTFRLVDLQSRNGTFVNGRRVYGSTFLCHNDRVQLGPSGPEFQFELDPPPPHASAARATSTGSTGEFGTASRISSFARDTAPVHPQEAAANAAALRPIGRATVERMLDDTFGVFKRESTKSVVVGLLCIAAVLIVGIGTWVYVHKSSAETVELQRESQAKLERTVEGIERAREEAQQQQAADAAVIKEQLKQSSEANRKILQSLNAKISLIGQNQSAEMARQKQSSSTGGNAPVTNGGTVEGTPTFAQLVDRADGLFKESKYSEAATVANQMIQLDPSRYEGYFFGGVSALEQKQTTKAKDLLARAFARAPLDKQHPIQQLLAEASQPE